MEKSRITDINLQSFMDGDDNLPQVTLPISLRAIHDIGSGWTEDREPGQEPGMEPYRCRQVAMNHLLGENG